MIYFLDNSLQLQKIVTSKNVISAIHEHELNGLIRADVELDLSYAKKFLILGIDHVGYYYKDEFYLHKIQRVEYDHVNESVKVVLRHIFFEDMIFGKLIEDVRPQNQDALSISRQTIDANTRWQTVMTDVTGHLSTNFYWQVPYEVIEFMTENYRIEYLPKILFDGEKINGFQLHLANKVGEDKNIRIPYGSRVLELKYEEDYSEIITKLVVHGKGEEVGDGYGRRINISDINFNRNGVKSPVGSLYLEDESITNTYGNDGQTPREGREVFEDIENPNALAEAGYQHYLQVSRPQMLFTANISDIGDVGIGDSVMIIRREYEVYFNARIHKLSVDLLYPEDAQVELGDYKHFKESKIARKTREKNNRVQGQLSDRITRLKREANEHFDNEVAQWRSEFEQAMIDATAEVEAMRVTMTEEFETAQREFEEEFNQSVAEAKQHADDVADAKSKQVQDNLDSFKGEHEQLVGALQGNIIDLDGELEEARADVSGILGRLTGIDGSITGIRDSLSDVEGTLTSTKTQLENQITSAKDDLQNQLDNTRAELEGIEVGGRNWFAKSEVVLSNNLRYDDQLDLYYNVGINRSFSIFRMDSFGLELNQKYILAFEIKSNIPELELRANTYINGSVSSVSNNSPELIEGEWVKVYTEPFLYHTETTASAHIYFNQDLESSRDIEIRNVQINRGTILQDYQEAPEDTDNKITNINQTITNIEGELSTKVEQTEVDTLKGTVTQQGTLLSQTVGELSSKADKSVVDTLTGRVENTESSVTQNSEEIAKRLTKSVYDEDKNATDAQITQWSNLTSETAEGLTQTITRLSTAEGKVTKAQADIIANADEIATKVSGIEFDALTDIVSDSSTAISQNAQNINLKANQTDLNQVTQRVTSAESELSVQAGQIELRATKSELGDVENRVTSTEAALIVADGQISSVVGRVAEAESDISSVVQDVSSVVQDVSSITSTVTSLEGNVATQGSQINQTKDVIDSKVWLDDVAGINPNLIPFTDVSVPETKPHWNNWGSASTNTWVDNLGYMNVDTTDTNGTIRIQSAEIDFVEGQEYTLSFLARTSSSWNTDGVFSYTFILWPGKPSNQILSSGKHTIQNLTGRLSGLRRYTHTFTANHTGIGRIMLGTYKFDSNVYSRFSFKEPKLERGSERTPYLNAFSNIEQTANSIKLSVLGELDGGYVTKSEFDITVEGIESRVAKIDGGGVLTQSDISVTSGSIIIGSREISNSTLASMIAVSPSAVNIITNKLNLTGNANVKGQIESISMSAVKAEFADLFAARVRAGVVTADYVEGFNAKFSSLYTLNANMEKLIVQNVFTRGVKALSIEAVEANIGSIRSKILTSDVVTSSHIASGTALIDKIFSSTAMFSRMMSKNGFITTLNTVTIDTDKITIRRPDGARLINNGMLRASFDVQIRPNHAASAVSFTGINYATSSATWQTFEHFYTDWKGSKLLISWAVDFYGPSASEYIEVRVRGFGNNNPIGTSNKRIFSNGSTAYLNHTVNLGVPDYTTIQAYLEFRRSPDGSSAQNTVRARVLRVSITD